MSETVITQSPEETMALGERLGRKARPGDCFAIRGDLGAGKTVMAKGIARGLGVPDEITSPTYTLMETYEGRLPFYHFDLYRIERAAELDQLFFEEYWEGDGVSVIEWSERADGRLPEDRVTISMRQVSPQERSITIERTAD